MVDRVDSVDRVENSADAVENSAEQYVRLIENKQNIRHG
jgi:hypothetical protein